MKLFSQDAELLLFEKVQSLAENYTSWRAIHINFSEYGKNYSEQLRTHMVTYVIRDLLNDYDGYIYLCGDGDVFILFQGVASKLLAILGEHFKGLSNSQNYAQPEDKLYTVFDLSQHWQIFYALSKNKVTALREPSQPVQQSAAHAQPALPELDAELFRTFQAQRPSRSRLKVLVVEDDAFTRRLLLTTLKGQYDIVEAASGVDAIMQYNLTAPDLVFLDIGLPDVNGQTILDKFLSFDKAAYVVMLSANSIKENILAALKRGARGFITKPFTKDKLLHYLNDCEQHKTQTVKETVS